MRFTSALLIVFTCFVACEETTESSGPPADVRWADAVLGFSSEYDSTEWNAGQMLGEPDTYPDYGDIETAWTSELRDGMREFVELGFNAHPAPASSIAIFETYNPGFVDTIYVKNPNTGGWDIVWQDTAAAAGVSSRIFVVNFPLTSFNVTQVRIAMDMTAVIGWNEIDAVAIDNEPIPSKPDSTWNAAYR